MGQRRKGWGGNNTDNGKQNKQNNNKKLMASTNLQIDTWCRPRVRAWLGVHSSDQLPDLAHLPPKPGGYTLISNTSSSTHPGVHWITLGGLLDTTAPPFFFSAFGDRPDDYDQLYGTRTRFAGYLPPCPDRRDAAARYPANRVLVPYS